MARQLRRFRDGVAIARSAAIRAIVQFIKGAWEPAEKAVLSRWADQLEFHAMEKAYLGNPRPGTDIQKATRGNHLTLIQATQTLNWCAAD